MNLLTKNQKGTIFVEILNIENHEHFSISANIFLVSEQNMKTETFFEFYKIFKKHTNRKETENEKTGKPSRRKHKNTGSRSF